MQRAQQRTAKTTLSFLRNSCTEFVNTFYTLRAGVALKISL